MRRARVTYEFTFDIDENDPGWEHRDLSIFSIAQQAIEPFEAFDEVTEAFWERVFTPVDVVVVEAEYLEFPDPEEEVPDDKT